MTETVLDSSALLCLRNAAPGADRVEAALEGAVVGTVNLAETIGKLRERGLSAAEAREVFAGLPIEVRPFSEEQAHAAGALRPATRALGLSLGDRACLPLALELQAPVLTTDREWRKLDIGVDIRALR